MKKLWDISPPITAQTPAFPGDTTYSQQWTAQLAPGCPVNISAITMSPHVGAHADAPLHYANGAAPIGLVDIWPYLGACRVIHAIGCGPLIHPEHLAHASVSCSDSSNAILLVCVRGRSPEAHRERPLA